MENIDWLVPFTLIVLLILPSSIFIGIAKANSRDDFPGRRQGGGTWETDSTEQVDKQDK